MRKLLHRIAHWLGWNREVLETYHRYDDGFIVTRFRCSCGKLRYVSPWYFKKP